MAFRLRSAKCRINQKRWNKENFKKNKTESQYAV